MYLDSLARVDHPGAGECQIKDRHIVYSRTEAESHCDKAATTKLVSHFATYFQKVRPVSYPTDKGHPDPGSGKGSFWPEDLPVIKNTPQRVKFKGCW